MQQFSIPIGTSGNGNLNLADGLPLFPKIGTSRAGYTNTARSNTLIDAGVTIIFSRTKISAYWEFFFGVLGPAIAFEFPNAHVTLDNTFSGGGQVAVALGSNQQMVAGMGAGLVVGAGFRITQQFFLPEAWYSPWKFAWRTALDLNLKFEIDFIKLLFELIKLLIGESGSAGLLAKDTASKLAGYLALGSGLQVAQSFKFYAYATDSFGPNKKITATPKYILPLDFVNLVPGLASFVKRMAAIIGDVKLGPQLEIQMPVTLALDSFGIQGGQGPDSTAQYGPVSYDGSTAIASGSKAFSTTAQRFTTNVSYSSGFAMALSCYFKITVCKVFSFQLTSHSLDILHLFGLGVPPTTVYGSVTSSVQSGCVLIPSMSMSFISSSSDPNYPPVLNSAVSDVSVTVEVSLQEEWVGPVTHIQLRINPEVPDFPTAIPIDPGQRVVSTKYTFRNQCIVSGDPQNPDKRISPSATSPYQSYHITATIDPNAKQPCADWEITAPLKVQNRVLLLTRAEGTEGDAPVYNSQGGAQLNADPSKSPNNIGNSAVVKYLFPYAPGATPSNAVPIKMYLLNDERGAHTGSNVRITFDSGATADLSSPAEVTVPLPRTSGSFRIEWLSPGPQVNYSNLFFLILDAGCSFGQAEFWLSVWNWK